jgi:hypothetical protein
MVTKEIVQARIESLKEELNSGTWPTLEGYIKGQIAAYEQEIKDIQNG